MKDYTIIPNAILRESQLSLPARYLHCVLLRYCGKDDFCFPSQKKLGQDLGCSDRHIRKLIKELEAEGLVVKTRKGYNRANNYKVAKDLTSNRNQDSSLNDGNDTKSRKPSSVQLGTTIPLHQGTPVPPNSIYLKGKDNNTFSSKGLEKLRKAMVEKGIMPDRQLRLKSADFKAK